MFKKLFIVLMSTVFMMPFAANADDTVVEVMLIDELDESRGYCLDIAGGKGENAPVERGLQAHTCYNYLNEILVDQGFDPELVEKGQFKITYFDVCMTASAIEEGATLGLESCDESETQQFSLSDNGQLVTAADSSLCVTVSSTEKKEGRGSTPVHVMRPVTLQKCEESNAAYQSWTLNSL